MKTVTRILIIGLAGYALFGCGQPDADQQDQAGAGPAAAATPADGAKLASIDADGNIAPFGFAAKQPVPVADAAVATVTGAQPAATSDLYGVHCAACHGADAQGVQGLGLNLVSSELVSSSSQAELVAFLQTGRPADSPDNSTGVPMPAFAWMSAAQLDEITAYLQSLTK